jgi:hypothetical protein
MIPSERMKREGPILNLSHWLKGSNLKSCRPYENLGKGLPWPGKLNFQGLTVVLEYHEDIKRSMKQWNDDVGKCRMGRS